MTIESYGFANLEFASLDNSTLINTVVGHIDSEGTVGAGLYLEGLSNCHFRMGDAPSAGTLAQIVGRNVAYSAIHANSPLTNDMDANCSTSMWMGARSGFLNYRMRGLAYDSARNATQLAIAASVTRAPEFESRNNGWVYPGRGIGQHITPRNINTALNGTHAGSLPFVVTAERTCTLPTLVSDATTGTSYVGVIFDIANLTASGGANVIVNTDGTQVFNRVVAKTSHTVAPGTGVIIEGIDLPDGTFCWKAHAYTLITV